MKHKFWGTVAQDWAGFSAEASFSNAAFSDTKITVFLGEEFGEDGEDRETPPSHSELDYFQLTYERFLAEIDQVLREIRETCFQRYRDCYAHHYEAPSKSGVPPLNICSAEQHFNFISEPILLRIVDEDCIVIPMRYELDQEHGLEVRICRNKVIEIGGIAETG